MKLVRVFDNPFLAAPVSISELISCSTDARERLRSGNAGGIWDGVLAGLNAALSGLSAAVGADLVKLGLRMSAKLVKTRFRRQMTSRVGRIQSCVAGHYGVASGEVKKVFPRGRQGLLRTPDDLLGGELASMVNALTPLAPAMGATGTTALGLAQELHTSWTDIYEQSERSTAEKTMTEAALRKARVQLGQRMHLALLTVAAHFVAGAAAEGKVLTKKEIALLTARYFRQDLLMDRQRRKTPGN